MSTSLVKVVFGVLGNMTAAFLFLSPLPTFRRIFRNRKVEEFSGVPYLTAALNCSLWTFYGLPVVNFQVLVVTVNAAGASLEIFYICIYLLFSDGKPRMKVVKLFIAMATGFILMAGLVVGLVNDLDTRRTILGVLGATLATIMYAAPLTIMRMVIRTKSVEYMPFLLSLFVFLNSLAWTIYAFVPDRDVYIAVSLKSFHDVVITNNNLRNVWGAINLIGSLPQNALFLILKIGPGDMIFTEQFQRPWEATYQTVPNVIGLVLGTGQLVLYAIYRRSTPRKPFLAPSDESAVDIAAEKIAPSPDAPEKLAPAAPQKLARAPDAGMLHHMQTQKPISPVTLAPNNV